MVKRIPLDNVCAKKIPTLSSQYDGLIDYVDISSVDNAEKRIVSMQCVSAKEAPSRAKQLLEVGDILVSTVRPNLNAVAMVEQQTDNLLVGSTGYCVLRCNDSIDKRYVFHFCQSPYFIDDMTSQATGASYPAVSSGIVKSSTIPDHPIEKQKLIADCLDKVSELIALRKEQLAKLDQLVKSRFIELFGEPLTLLESGKTISLEKVFSEITVGFVGEAASSYVKVGIPYLRTQNVRKGYIDFSGLIYVSEEFHGANRKSQIKPGDIVVSRVGVNRGMAAVIPQTLEEANIANCLIIKKEKTVNSEYLAYYLNMSYGLSPKFGASVGSAQGVINTAILKKWEVFLPPYSQQEQFAVFVEQTDKSKLAIQQSLDKLETLKKSLMQEYFG